MSRALRGAAPATTGRPHAEAAALRPTAGAAPRYAFWMLVVFLVLEYVRPPVVVQFKLQMLITLLIPVLFLSARVRPWSRVLTLQVSLLAWCAKSIPIAYNWFAVYFTARTLYGNVAIAIALTWVCSYLPDLRKILWLYVAIMVYQALWALAHGGTGTGGFLHDENDLALACATAFPLAFFGLEQLAGRARWASGAAMVLLLAGIVASISRGGFVGLVCCGLYCWFASSRKLLFVALVLGAVVLVPVFAPSNYVEEIRSISQTNEGTAKGRRFLWTAAVNMWKANPVLGVGGGNAIYLVGRYQPTDFEEREYVERDWSGTTIHSFYFQLLPEQGAVGMALVFAMIGSQFACTARLIRDVRRRRGVPARLRRDAVLYAHGINGALIAFLTAGAFLSVAYYPYIWYFTALAAALDIGVRRDLGAASQAPPRAGDREGPAPDQGSGRAASAAAGRSSFATR